MFVSTTAAEGVVSGETHLHSHSEDSAWPHGTPAVACLADGLLAAGMETSFVFDTPNAKIPQTFTAADPCVRSRNGRTVAFASSSISPGALVPDRAPTSSMSCRRHAECRIITLRLASA